MIELLIAVASFTVCWEPPTENVDDTPIEGPIAYALHYGTSSGNYQTIIDIGAQQAIDQGNCETREEPVGNYYMVMTAIDNEGDESVFSNEVLKASTDDTPKPPVVLETEATVFTVIKQPDRFVLLPIGTVPPGTECNPNESVNDHGVVPNASVVWTSPTGPRPVVVVARCNG